MLTRLKLSWRNLSPLFLMGLILINAWWVGSLIKKLPFAKAETGKHNIFYFLFLRNEMILLPIFLVALGLLFWWIIFRKNSNDTEGRRTETGRRFYLLSGLVLLIGVVGTDVVYHRYALCTDELMAEFQAKIFANFHYYVAVPSVWKEYGDALSPTLLANDWAREIWISPYLPVWSLYRAFFWKLQCPTWASPLLAGGCILLLWGIRKNCDEKIWRWSPWIAALLLATSAQFLVNAMNAYAMTGHLFLSLSWLWFYTFPGRRGWWWAPWIGALAIGLHQPHMHLLFAAPFLLRMFRDHFWRWLAYFLSVYSLALVGTAAWWKLNAWSEAAHQAAVLQNSTLWERATVYFRFDPLLQYFIQSQNAALLILWCSPLLFIFVFRFLKEWKDSPALAQDLFFGFALNFCFYFFFNTTQAHGWGYRYGHVVLGNLVILGAMGFAVLVEEWGQKNAYRVFYASLVLAWGVIIPLRFLQVETFVRPYARTMDYLKSRPEKLILLDYPGLYYGGDFLQNDPFLRSSPLIFSGPRLKGERREKLLEKKESVRLTADDLAVFGVIRTDPEISEKKEP